VTDEKLTSNGYWHNFWSDTSKARPLFGRPISVFQKQFDRWLPRNADWTAIEIGAYPGANLLALCLSHKYRPVALDILPQVMELPAAAERAGIHGLEALHQDFLHWETDRRFNVVVSFGFIEHFADPAAVLKKHWELVAPDGYLVVSVPLFSPVQLMVRKIAFTPEKMQELYAVHNAQVMTIRGFRQLCREVPGADVKFLGPVANMMMPYSGNEPFVRPVGRWIVRAMRLVNHLPRLIGWSSGLFSPSALMIARKPPA